MQRLDHPQTKTLSISLYNAASRFNYHCLKSLIEKPSSKGSKIFFADPVIYNVLEAETGNFREAFVVFALKNHGTSLAETDETKGDLIFNGIHLEIGGANKNQKLADFVIHDNIDLPVRNCIPMWVLGMGW